MFCLNTQFNSSSRNNNLTPMLSYILLHSTSLKVGCNIFKNIHLKYKCIISESKQKLFS